MKTFIIITWFTSDGEIHSKNYHRKDFARKFAIKLTEDDSTLNREWCKMDYSGNIIEEFCF